MSDSDSDDRSDDESGSGSDEDEESGSGSGSDESGSGSGSDDEGSGSGSGSDDDGSGSDNDDADSDENSDDDDSDGSGSGSDDDDDEKSNAEEMPADEAAQKIQKAFRNFRKRKDAHIVFDPNDQSLRRDEKIERAVRVLLAPDIPLKQRYAEFRPQEKQIPKWYSMVPSRGARSLPMQAAPQQPVRQNIVTRPQQAVPTPMAARQPPIPTQIEKQQPVYSDDFRYRDRYRLDNLDFELQQGPPRYELNMLNTKLPPSSSSQPTSASAAPQQHAALNYSGITLNIPQYLTAAADVMLEPLSRQKDPMPSQYDYSAYYR